MKRIASYRFTAENSAYSNMVFLLTAKDSPPFMGPVTGWKIKGYGKAPWPRKDCDVAIMFEKITPAEGYGNSYGHEMDEGTLIWQHGKEEWIEGTEAYKKEWGG